MITVDKKSKNKITEKQPERLVEMWEFICTYRKHNYSTSPSMEILVRAGFAKSRSHISYLLDKMMARKMVVKIPHKHRGIIPLDKSEWE